MTKRIHRAWIILIASSISIFTNISIRFSYNILMPEMIVSLKITKTPPGGIASSFYLAYTIFSPLLGFLVDRVSARKLLILFSFIMGGGTFLMGKPISFLQACFFFAIVAVGSSAMWTPCSPWSSAGLGLGVVEWSWVFSPPVSPLDMESWG